MASRVTAFEVTASEVKYQHPVKVIQVPKAVLEQYWEIHSGLGGQTASDRGQNHFILN